MMEFLKCGCFGTCSCESWKEMITEAMTHNEETWSDVVLCTLTEKELDIKFDAGFGLKRGKPFTLWTKGHVYFPSDYDGAEGVYSVSRNPNDKPPKHVGGGGG